MTVRNRLITPEKAIELVRLAIDDHKLGNEGPLDKALASVRTTDAQLVRRLDYQDEYYYLVGLRYGEKVAALARIDALYGAFLGAHISDKKKDGHLILDRDRALRMLREHPVIDLGDKLGRVPIREGAFCLYPSLVWRPCKESRSPYCPFYQVALESRVIFIGYDGRTYPALHDLDYG